MRLAVVDKQRSRQHLIDVDDVGGTYRTEHVSRVVHRMIRAQSVAATRHEGQAEASGQVWFEAIDQCLNALVFLGQITEHDLARAARLGQDQFQERRSDTSHAQDGQLLTLGFELMATRGTSAFLNERGVDCLMAMLRRSLGDEAAAT